MPAHVLTLVAAAEPLDLDFVETVRSALSRLGALVERPVWLDEPRACDLFFDELNDDQADAAAREAIGARAMDCFAQGAEDRRKRLLLADMESTLIENELLDDLAAAAGIGAKVSEITARAMNGELDFTQALEARVGLLAGFDAGVLEEIAAGIRYMPGAKALVATMARHGAATAIVSGGFDIFTARVAQALGVDSHSGNRLDIADGRLTGKVVPPVLTRESKYKALVEGAAARKLPLSATLAVGDGANDLDMIAAAGLGVAYHAKPIVTARAQWRIDHADLTALLYAQGYRADEIVNS